MKQKMKTESELLTWNSGDEDKADSHEEDINVLPTATAEAATHAQSVCMCVWTVLIQSVIFYFFSTVLSVCSEFSTYAMMFRTATQAYNESHLYIKRITNRTHTEQHFERKNHTHSTCQENAKKHTSGTKLNGSLGSWSFPFPSTLQVLWYKIFYF